MDNLDKEYNKRFQNEAIPEDDFDVDGLWSDIEQGLDEEKKPGFLPMWYLLLGILLVLIPLGLQKVMVTQNQNDFNQLSESSASVISADEEQLPTIDRGPKKSDYLNNQETGLDKKTNTSKPLIKKDIQNTNSNTETITFDSYQNKPSIISPNKSNNSIAFNQKSKLTKNTGSDTELKEGLNFPKNSASESSLIGRINNPVQELTPSDKLLSDEAIELTVEESKGSVSEAKNDLNIKFLTPIPSIKAIQLQLTNEQPRPELLNVQPNFDTIDPLTNDGDNNTDDNEQKFNSTFVIGVYGGMNKTFHQLDNTLTNKYDFSDWGQNIGLDAALLLKENWLIRSGLEYHNYRTIFDYNKTTSDDLIRENQLIKIWVNGQDTLKSDYGNKQVTRTEQRIVLHHNQYQQFSIPLEFGWQSRCKKVTLGLTAGVTLNFLIDQSGRRLDPMNSSSIVDFEKDSANSPLNAFQIGWQINPFIGYSLAEQLVVKINPYWKMQQNKSKAFQQIGLNLGLQFEF